MAEASSIEGLGEKRGLGSRSGWNAKKNLIGGCPALVLGAELWTGLSIRKQRRGWNRVLKEVSTQI